MSRCVRCQRRAATFPPFCPKCAREAAERRLGERDAAIGFKIMMLAAGACFLLGLAVLLLSAWA